MPQKRTTALMRAWMMLPMPLMTAMMASPMVWKTERIWESQMLASVVCEAVQCGWTYTRHDATHCEGFVEGFVLGVFFSVVAFAKSCLRWKWKN
jgi:hypothetical protein